MSQIKQWPKTAMVGYIDTTAIGSMSAITKEQIQSYNVIIFGFTDANGELPPQLQRAVKEIRKLEAPDTLNLISVGGAGGTLSLTSQTITNILSGLKSEQLDGIDLDLEDPSIDIDTLSSFTAELSLQLADNYLLTIAPILAGTPDQPTLNIPGGASLKPLYSQIHFDAILVQAYNSGTYFSYPLPSDKNVLVSESSANIISAAYNSLQKDGDILSTSKIVIGIPSNAGAAPTQSNLWDTVNFEPIPVEILSNVKSIQLGEYGIDSTQFGGLMSWSLNCDAQPSSYPPYFEAQNAPAGYFAAKVASKVV
ncbi:glycosyl hydrolase family 18 protein [Shewanella woodyi]|uniref:glycosyl hydrolase family 18 protein n=1 Tax=Shewanella woodyi TaxID=60961 RepID=UPI0007EA57F1|nr:glycosyl hydrolase family 18 protein [Shewanella woodyi]